ncbi:hypothetical protein ACFE04_014855 [Oxalis oulophora]
MGESATATVTETRVILIDDEVIKLRKRWELACVLNFLKVFGSVIGNDLKTITAEEIEIGLSNPNSTTTTSLANLHISLLKGIPPVAKNLMNVSGAWVTALCKKLATWWPWVAEGEIPLTVSKGEEVAKYNELDPISRLQLLKALCELRADQGDIVSHISDSLKQGTDVVCFRKEKIGDDGNGTSYWYDGDVKMGYRLYKEVIKPQLKSKVKGKPCSSLPDISFEWETLATNLEEFRKVAEEFSHSRNVAEKTVAMTLESDPIPSLEKTEKKKERALKRKQREEELLNYRNSYNVGVPRSCRSRRPINYTFDDYDRAIEEAIQVSKNSKSRKEQRAVKKSSGHKEDASNEDSDDHSDSNGNSTGSGTDSDTDSDKVNEEAGDDSEDNEDKNYNGSGQEDNGTDWEDSDEEQENHISEKNVETIIPKPKGSRWSERLNGASDHPVMENGTLGAKSRLRQRPTRNSAMDSIILDSEEDYSSEQGNCSSDMMVSDSEDEHDN